MDEPVVERPALPVGHDFPSWSPVFVNALLQVFQQYGYRLNRTPTANELEAGEWDFANMPLVDGRPITDGHPIGDTDPRSGTFAGLSVLTDAPDATAGVVLSASVEGFNTSTRFAQLTTGVDTTPAIIISESSFHRGGFAIVHGRKSDDLNGTVFLDLVLHRAIGGVSVVQSGTVNGSPAARTYSSLGSGNRELRLAMASDEYDVSCSYERM